MRAQIKLHTTSITLKKPTKQEHVNEEGNEIEEDIFVPPAMETRRQHRHLFFGVYILKTRTTSYEKWIDGSS